VRWDGLDLDAGLVEVRGTVVQVKGTGLVIKRPKSDSGKRELELSRWAVAMLRRRRESAVPNKWGWFSPRPPVGCGNRRTPRPISEGFRPTRAIRGDLTRVLQDRGDADGRARANGARGGRPARAREGVDDPGSPLRAKCG
jgi:hypothetical protein